MHIILQSPRTHTQKQKNKKKSTSFSSKLNLSSCSQGCSTSQISWQRSPWSRAASTDHPSLHLSLILQASLLLLKSQRQQPHWEFQLQLLLCAAAAAQQWQRPESLPQLVLPHLNLQTCWQRRPRRRFSQSHLPLPSPQIHVPYLLIMCKIMGKDARKINIQVLDIQTIHNASASIVLFVTDALLFSGIRK